MYPETTLPILQKLDIMLSKLPSLFAARCLVGLTPE